EMPHASQSVPFFHALATFVCRRNRLYRIYVRDDELVLIWAGHGSEGLLGAKAVSAMKGGGLIGGALGAMLDPSEKRSERLRELDQKPLSESINDDPRNMRMLLSDIAAVRLCPRSENHALNFSDYEHQAILRLRHRTLGRFRLGISSVEDVQFVLKH